MAGKSTGGKVASTAGRVLSNPNASGLQRSLAGSALAQAGTAKVEHCFHVVKCLFRHRKTRYRGLAKNTAQLFSLFALANLVLARRFLGSSHTQVASRV